MNNMSPTQIATVSTGVTVPLALWKLKQHKFVAAMTLVATEIITVSLRRQF